MPTWVATQEQIDLILSKEVGEVWFKRNQFRPEGNYSTRPKWHALISRQRESEVGVYYIWEAACGYRYRIAEIIQSLDFRVSPLKTKSLSCAKCVAKIDKEKTS